MLIASESEQALQLAPVEADHDVVIDDDHRHGHPTRPGNEFRASGFVLRNVFCHERDTLLRKKLFRGAAGRSGRGPVHRHLSIHHEALFTAVARAKGRQTCRRPT